MAELGSTGGNLDNILQYLLQRIEKVGIAEGVTGGGGTTNLDNYYTKAEVNNLITGYATETWVKAQGYLTSANLTNYATQSWVENKGYLTSNDLAEYAKTSDIPKDYVNEATFKAFKGNYDSLAASVKDANDYTDGKIAALNISQYAKVDTLNQVVADVNTAFDAVNNKFADYALLAGNNTLTGTNTFLGYLKLKKGENASGYLFLQDDTTHANYEYRNGVYFAVSNGGFAIHAHKDGAWANQIAWIAMDSLETTLQQGISVNKITVRGGGALFNGEAVFNYKATFDAKQTWFGDMYIEKYSSYGGFGKGAYFGWKNVANMKLLPTMESSNILLYRGLITPRVDFSFGSEEVITSSIVESASGVLELLSSSYNPGTLKIGNAYLTYDSDNNALFVKGKDGASVNLVATGDVAAFSGLGSGFDTLTDLTLTNKLTVGNSIQLGTNSLAMDKYGALVIDGGKQQEIYFKGVAYFDSDLELDFVAANDAYLLKSSIRTLHVGTSTNFGITSITADDTNVYITINNSRYRISATQV